MKLTLPMIVIAALWSQPAAACYTGPIPVEFAGQTAKLTQDAKGALEGYAKQRGTNGQNRLLVIFYNGTPTRASERALHQKRQDAIRAFLLGKRVPRYDFSIVTTKKAPPQIIVQMARRAKASVELTSGCG